MIYDGCTFKDNESRKSNELILNDVYSELKKTHEYICFFQDFLPEEELKKLQGFKGFFESYPSESNPHDNDSLIKIIYLLALYKAIYSLVDQSIHFKSMACLIRDFADRAFTFLNTFSPNQMPLHGVLDQLKDYLMLCDSENPSYSRLKCSYILRHGFRESPSSENEVNSSPCLHAQNSSAASSNFFQRPRRKVQPKSKAEKTLSARLGPS